MKNDHIMKIHPDKPSEEDRASIVDNSKDSVKVFTMKGFHDTLDEGGYPVLSDTHFYKDGELVKIDKAEDNPKAYAYKRKNTYYVKMGPDGKLFNPIGMFTEKKEAKINQVKGRMDFRWISVKVASFNNYIKFLKTRNILYLTNAERESL